MIPDEMYQLDLFNGLDQSELEWIILNSNDVMLKKGDYYFREGEVADSFYIVIEGELQITRTFDGEEQVMGTTPRGIMGGEVSLLIGVPSGVSARALMPTHLIVLNEQTFRRMFAEAPEFGRRVLQTAAERVAGTLQRVTQQEKMAALGKLSAGLAHELNNPASAARRAARTLHEELPHLLTVTIRLNKLDLNEAQLKTLITWQGDAIAHAADVPVLAPIERSDREDELGDWMSDHNIENAWDIAPTFVNAGVTRDDMQVLIEHFPEAGLGTILNWMECTLSIASLVQDVEESSDRISQLVTAVKEYTYMDRAKVQEIDVHAGLESTLRMMTHKTKNVVVTCEFDDEMPKIMANGGELNQVWTNLIDNAIDAMDGGGSLKIITRCENDFAMVEIADSGSGIPPEVQAHMFEPFYTTKGVGQGSGLGLDIVYRIVTNHRGTIDVDSKPGQTRFIVRLPITQNG